MIENEELGMPICDFSEFNPSEEEFKEAIATFGDYFKPGKHDLTIADAVYDGQCESDKNWAKVKVTFTGTGKKTLDHYLLLPLKTHKFVTKTGKETTFCFKRFVDFCNGIGKVVTKDTLPAVVKSMYPPSTLNGRKMTAVMDFQKAHPTKHASGQTQVTLSDGNVMAKQDGAPILFADPASAKAYCKEAGVDYDNRVSILSFEKAPEDKSDANW